MSHVVEIQTKVRDAAAVEAACRRLGLAPPQVGTFQLFSAQASGLAVQLVDWRYPVVCDLASGTIAYDNFSGRWGERDHLDRLLQMYGVEKAKLEARRAGHTVTEQSLADGSIKLTVTLGGDA